LPVVPRYQRQVNLQTPTIREPAMDVKQLNIGAVNDAAQGFAKAAMGLGQELNNERVEQQHQDNLSFVQGLTYGFLKDANGLQNQIANLKGQDAVTTVKNDPNAPPGLESTIISPGAGWQAEDGVKKLAADTLNKCTNDDQKRMLSSVLLNHVATITNFGADHESKQKEVMWQNNNSLATDEATNAAYMSFNLLDKNKPDWQSANQNVINCLGLVDLKSQHDGITGDAAAYNKSVYMQKALGQYITDTIKTDPERAVMVYNQYKDKLSPEMQMGIESKMHPSIVAYNAQKISDDLITRFGRDEMGALATLNQEHKDDPDLPQYRKIYASNMTTYRVAYNQQREDLRNSVAEKMLLCGDDTSQMYSVLHTSGLSKVDQDTLETKYIKPKIKTQNKIASGKANYTPEQKFWIGYGKNGGHINNARLCQEYYTRIQDGEDISDAEQKKYDKAAYYENGYNAFLGNKGYEIQDKNEQAQEQPQLTEGQKLWYKTYYTAYQKFVDNGMTPEKARQKAEQCTNDLSNERY